MQLIFFYLYLMLHERIVKLDVIATDKAGVQASKHGPCQLVPLSVAGLQLLLLHVKGNMLFHLALFIQKFIPYLIQRLEICTEY